jgi:LPPG:FO 2-phospho-L-lactate transferase
MSAYSPRHVLALSGGVGGAKLALGLAKTLNPEQLTIVANTADDFEHLGLAISPDLDTVMYTLADLSNKELGWGLANESWNAMAALEQLGGDTWFRLGDRDLATHLERSLRLNKGDTLTEVTDYLCGIEHRILPMTNDPVRTRVKTADGELAFQEYFVRDQCQPAVSGFYFSGLEQAQPNPELLALLASDELDAIVICPSNPFVSVEPILAMTGVREAMKASSAPVIAVSPIVGGLAIKGPAAKMMAELDMPSSAHSVAAYYGDLLDGFVLDQTDAHLQRKISDLAVPVLCAQTIMRSLQDRTELAQTVLQFAGQISSNSCKGKQ